MSNVKPGDLAQVIRAAEGYNWTLGRIVKIANPCCRSGSTLIWAFEDPLRGPDNAYAKCAYDRCLKRIDPLKEDDANVTDVELKTPIKETVNG